MKYVIRYKKTKMYFVKDLGFQLHFTRNKEEAYKFENKREAKKMIKKLNEEEFIIEEV